MKTTDDIAFLEMLHACEAGIKFVQTACKGSLHTAWRRCKRAEWMCWLLCRIAADKKQLRLLGCRFVRETPLADGRKVWDLLADERSRKAVEMSEAFANGKASHEKLAAAAAAASPAEWAAAINAAWAAAWAAARAAAGDAAGAAEGAAEGAATGDAAAAAQCTIIREMFPWTKVAKLIDVKRP